MDRTGMYKSKRKMNVMWMRLLMTIFAFLCIPLLLVNVYTVNRDMERIQEQRYASYESYLDRFGEFFNDEMNKMISCTVEMALDETIIDKTLDRDSKYRWDIFAEIKKYQRSVPVVKEMYLYVEYTDYFFGSKSGYDSASFLKRFFAEGEVPETACIADWIGEKQFIRATHKSNEGLFVVYPVTIRKAGASAIFCYISNDSLREAYFGLEETEAGIYICDSEGNLLLSNERMSDDLIQKDEIRAFVSDHEVEVQDIELDRGKYYLFKEYDYKNGLCYLAAVSEEELMYPMDTIRSFNTMLLTAEVVLCLVMLVFVAYLNYRPIHRLKQKYMDNPHLGRESNEIVAIERLLDRTMGERQTLDNLVQERTNQLSVYVLKGMLNGENIPEEQRRLLELNDRFRYVFAVAVQGINADSDIEGDVIERLTGGSDRIIYMMADSHEHCLLFIFMVTEEEKGVRPEMAEQLCRLLKEETLNENIRAGVGECCEIEDGLRNARLTALIAMDQSVYGETMFYENALEGFKHMEYYPSRQMLVFMRNLREGSEEQALATLDELMDCVRRDFPSFIVRQYVCYDIVNEFIRQINSLDVKLEEGKLLALMRFEKLEELQSIMEELTISMCRQVYDRLLEAEKEQIQKILQFINDNISDPDLSREIVASRFQISVNTVSMLCSNVIGCGFRELIVARRIEYAQELLRETDLSVSEIAMRSGFRDSSYFIKIFKSISGKTPKNYKSEMIK